MAELTWHQRIVGGAIAKGRFAAPTHSSTELVLAVRLNDLRAGFSGGKEDAESLFATIEDRLISVPGWLY
jgi:hypothetical protein